MKNSKFGSFQSKLNVKKAPKKPMKKNAPTITKKVSAKPSKGNKQGVITPNLMKAKAGC